LPNTQTTTKKITKHQSLCWISA